MHKKSLLNLLLNRRVLVALLSAVALSCALVLPSFAEAVTNTRQAVTFEQATPCTGELITFTGEIHGIFRTTSIDENGRFQEIFKTQFHGKGTGTSGTEYIFNDEITQDANGQVGMEITFVQSFNILARGSAPNLTLFMQGHMTVNANGEVTAFFDQFREICRG